VGDFAEAAQAHGRALALVEHDEWIGAELLVSLARCHLCLSDHEAAAGYRTRALHRLDGVYHPPAERLRAELNAAER